MPLHLGGQAWGLELSLGIGLRAGPSCHSLSSQRGSEKGGKLRAPGWEAGRLGSRRLAHGGLRAHPPSLQAGRRSRGALSRDCVCGPVGM